MKLIYFLACFSFSFSYSQEKFNEYNQYILSTSYGLELSPIVGGQFLMGSPLNEKNRLADEGPVHKVQVDSFWMAKHETTWDLYNLFMSRNLDEFQPAFNSKNEVNIDIDAVSGATTPYVEMSFGMGTDGFPAISMTQLAAKKFCQWLSAITGNFYRLPTEAEWEYACRAGSEKAYSFGDDPKELNNYAWFKDNSNNKYHKVGQKLPNNWGLYDMHGNVSEWTLDAYNATTYLKASQNLIKNPIVKPIKLYPRVVRGGSWKSSYFRLRSASRQASSKQWKKQDPQIPRSKWWHTDAQFVGFRVVRPYITPTIEEQNEYWNN
ncbi:formylglycine-generating enzyme family protein [Flavobacteriaceae bacterium]|nr:formylglycine-generating enzyme family protein [Flavobacteriaceae bacterium]MDC1459165.1 formylglycine-generating enzyme family protein [Flavobacteriaceae bacterium]MDC3221282.1 formylglycine-generating enzyme family protein [Flavobacteriaceae bacterium]